MTGHPNGKWGQGCGSDNSPSLDFDPLETLISANSSTVNDWWSGGHVSCATYPVSRSVCSGAARHSHDASPISRAIETDRRAFK